jgi:predicted ATPase
LSNRWSQNRQNWPLYLDWLEIQSIRGWSGQRLTFDFPIVAIVGENGTGKSTVLQAAAAFYRAPLGEKDHFASLYFPTTAWEDVTSARIKGFGRQGDQTYEHTVRKPTSRWLGNKERKIRPVRFIDLRRTQPIYARLGFQKIAKSRNETQSESFDDSTRSRASAILGKSFDGARHAMTEGNDRQSVPVLSSGGVEYSGFHQGAGENVIADLLAEDIPQKALVLIDEIETSLHPRAQRRLIRDLARIARLDNLQILLTTHSPYILQELPPAARLYVSNSSTGQRSVLSGVSADYAMTFMDDQDHPELDLFVEDPIAKVMIEEVLYRYSPDTVRRICIIPFGAANVGQSLGQMVEQDRFPRPTVVVLDGDQDPIQGSRCMFLPGGDAPERVVFAAVLEADCPDLSHRSGRSHAELVDALNQAMTQPDHHDWIRHAANSVVMGGEQLWRSLCKVWAQHCINREDVANILDEVELKLAD